FHCVAAGARARRFFEGNGSVATLKRPRYVRALAALRPGWSGPIRHIEGGKYPERLGGVDERGPPLLEGGDGVRAIGAVLLVDDHLAPVLDQDIARRLILIAKKRAPEIGPRLPIHRGPFPIGSEELLEFR